MLHLSVGLTIYISIILFMLGASVGSFLDCLAGRMVTHESVWKGRSHCDTCNHALGARDLVPVLSYLFSGGHCRYCHAKIPVESTIVELCMGCSFVALWLRYDLSVILFRSMTLFAILMGLSLVDLKTYTIPDEFHYAAIALFVGTAIFFPLRNTVLGLITGVLFAGALLILSLLFDKVSGKESLGGGDIKLFFSIGLFLPHPLLGLLHLILSCMTGLLFAGIIKKNRIPFGPAISFAGGITILFGEYILQWYLNLL